MPPTETPKANAPTTIGAMLTGIDIRTPAMAITPAHVRTA
jgi:hypothetical protein